MTDEPGFVDRLRDGRSKEDEEEEEKKKKQEEEEEKEEEEEEEGNLGRVARVPNCSLYESKRHSRASNSMYFPQK